MMTTEDIEEAITRLEKEIDEKGVIVFVKQLNKKTKELIGLSLSLDAKVIELPRDVNFDSLSAQGQKVLSEIFKFSKQDKHAGSRRQVIITFDDIIYPCFNVFQFLTRDSVQTRDISETTLVVFMRSCDIENKLRNDLKLFAALLAIYCLLSNTFPRRIIVHFGSLHKYL